MQKNENKFTLHKCHYEDMSLIYDKADEPEDGAWLWWYDNLGNAEYARMKFDAKDHFFPDTELIKEENIIGWSIEKIEKRIGPKLVQRF